MFTEVAPIKRQCVLQQMFFLTNINLCIEQGNKLLDHENQPLKTLFNQINVKIAFI